MTDQFKRDSLMVVGIDEVGRGCLAGPVGACAYAFRVPGQIVPKLRDSKKLSSGAREKLVPHLELAGFFGHGSSSAEEIDALSIVPANFQAMRRALENLIEKHRLSPSDLHVIVDGNELPPFSDMKLGRFQCLIKADDLVPEVSGASVLAKVKRDLWMRQQAIDYPGYSFESNAGYGSSAHMLAIKTIGPCALHRMSFAPMNQK